MLSPQASGGPWRFLSCAGNVTLCWNSPTLPVQNDTLSALIGDIYDCALDRGRWVATIERIATCFGACHGTILTQGARDVSFYYDWGMPPEWKQAFLEKYAPISPFLTLDWHFDIDDPVTVSRFMDPADLRLTAFHREFLTPLNWFDFLMVILEKSTTQISTFGVVRTPEAGLFDDQDKTLMRMLSPHIRRAIVFDGMIGDGGSRANNLRAALNALPYPMFLFDAQSACIEMNEAAEAFIRDSDALHMDGRAVRARDRSLDSGLSQAIAAGVSDHAQASALPRSFAFHQADGRGFVAHVMPLTPGLRSALGGQAPAVCVMFVQPVGELQPLPGEILVRLYGLTPAETRMLGLLARGFNLDDTAATLGIAMTTARTHLRHLFEKTGTDRQSALVRLALSGFPSPPPGHGPG